jgi:hypothetical protein
VVYATLIKVARDHIQNSAKSADLQAAFKVAQDAFHREVEARKVANETWLLDGVEN